MHSHLVIKNALSELDSLSAGLLTFCRDHNLSEEIYYDVWLALEEAVSNTIKYGYEDHEVHEIRVMFRLENQNLHLEIEDDAKAFNPLDAPAPDLSLPAREKQIGGLGIYLLRQVMDRVEYSRSGKTNILRMMKSIPPKPL